MQYQNGRKWREEIALKLKEIGIVCFDPYSKPFVKDIQECEESFEELHSLMENENFDEVEKRMKEIRIHDLKLVDRADVIIAYFDPKIASVGSVEEIATANRMKKPIFLVINGGKKKCPLWFLGTIPHRYIYDSFDQVIETIFKIDSGEKEMDSDRWKLLREEYR